jgi:hypothetical protein
MPETVRVVRVWNTPRGKAYCDPRHPKFGRLVTPRPDNRLALEVCLHESAHFALHCHPSDRWDYASLLEGEYAVERWVVQAFRRSGIPIPYLVWKFARQNVGCWIIKALKWGTIRDRDRAAPWIRPEIARFAFGRSWKRKLRLTHEALLADKPEDLESFLGF